MHRNQPQISVGVNIVLMLVMLNAFVLEQALRVNKQGYWPLLITVPLLLFVLLFWRKAGFGSPKRHP